MPGLHELRGLRNGERLRHPAPPPDAVCGTFGIGFSAIQPR